MDEMNINELLERIQKDPLARKAIEAILEKDDKEALLRCCAENAKRLGLDVTETEIRAAVLEAEDSRKSRTEEKIVSLPDEEIEQVSGGTKYINCENNTVNVCRTSFRQRENCWSNDGCDENYRLYSDYQCRHNYAGYVCGSSDRVDCDGFFF